MLCFSKVRAARASICRSNSRLHTLEGASAAALFNPRPGSPRLAIAGPSECEPGGESPRAAVAVMLGAEQSAAHRRAKIFGLRFDCVRSIIIY
eukprot:scaffold16092_cov127-Isochrysis_galbana.AAC.14